MKRVTAVYLITGFLGSGKTTFLNRIIKSFPKDRKLMILMNEFGDISVDGLLVEDEDLAMLEISKGSIFCVCVKVEKQIESATVFIINKVDRVNSQDLETVKTVIARHHPDPDIHETQYARIPLEKYLPDLIGAAPSSEKIAIPEPVSPEALETFIDDLLSDPGSSMTPPDRLLSVSYTWRGDAFSQFEAAVESIPDRVVRAKGIFQLDSETYLFNYVLERHEIEKLAPKKKASAHINPIVFIGPPEAIDAPGQVDFGGRLELDG